MKKNSLTAAEAARMRAEAAWLREFRVDFLGLSVRGFAKLCGLTDKAVNDMEEEKDPITPGIQRIIEHKTGHKFMQSITHNDTKLEILQNVDFIRPADFVGELAPKEEVVAPANELVPPVVEPAKPKEKRVPANMPEREKVSQWIKRAISVRNISQSELARQTGIPFYTISDLVQCKARLKDEVRDKMVNFIGYGPDISVLYAEPMPDRGAYHTPPELEDAIKKMRPAGFREPTAIGASEVLKIQNTVIEKVLGLENPPAEQVTVMLKGFGSPFIKEPEPPCLPPDWVVKPINKPEPELPQVQVKPINSYWQIKRGEQSVHLLVDMIAGSFTVLDEFHYPISLFSCCKEGGEAISLAEAILEAVKQGADMLKK